MGYYTLHRIRIINEYNKEKNLEKLREYIQKISGISFYMFGSILKDYSNEECDEGTKWYEYEHDMIAVSKFLPGFEIQVKGKGEEGEIWERIYKDGYSYSNEDEPSIFSDPDPGFVSDSNSGSDNDSNSYSDSEEEIYIEINKQKYKE